MAPGDVEVAFTKIRALSCNFFDGVDDYVEIPHNSAQLGANLSNGFTISAWIYPESIGEGGGKILDKSTNTTAGSGFSFRYTATPGNNLVVFQINGGTAGTSALQCCPVGQWRHALVTISSTQRANFYVNGVLSGTADQNLVQGISAITTNNVMRIGQQSTGTASTFDGGILKVKMWNRVLTTTEIQADYEDSPPQQGLIHNFKLGGDYTDYGKVGVTATNSGSVVALIDDNLAKAIKTQRTTAGSTGKYFLCSGQEGQIYHTAISG